MDVSIIIPTAARASRAQLIFRALESLFAQQGPWRAIPIVVANGHVYSQELLEDLRRDNRLRFLYRAEGCAPRAVAAGRDIVDTEFFGVLDDDDVYFPTALAMRGEVLCADAALDAVISNGWCRMGEDRTPMIQDLSRVRADPAAALMAGNWIHAAAGLYRTQRIGAEFFRDAPAMVEWTYIALRLALTRRIRFIDALTYEIAGGSVDSLSQSAEYLRLQPGAIKTILSLPAPPAIKQTLRKKYLEARHQLADLEATSGHLARAWRHHLASLRPMQGLRYCTYTRYLLWRRDRRKPRNAKDDGPRHGRQ